jgi:ectoine hydroxylase-related dioxygenase (phytanoyl-CoA dioxygenase family)
MLKDGYAVYPGVFLRSELDEVTAELARAPLTRSRAGARHLMGVPAVAALSTDQRLLSIAAEWSGGAAVAFRATLFDKSPDANWLVSWHQDTALPMVSHHDKAGWGPWSEKAGILYAHAPAAALERVIALRIHIDDSHEGNGPLRVLPGTHEQGLLSDAQAHEFAQRVRAVHCCADAGGVVAMRPLVLHASSKVATPQPRRVLHIEYTRSMTTADGVKLRMA